METLASLCFAETSKNCSSDKAQFVRRIPLAETQCTINWTGFSIRTGSDACGHGAVANVAEFVETASSQHRQKQDPAQQPLFCREFRNTDRFFARFRGASPFFPRHVWCS